MILDQLQEMVDRMKQARLAYEGELEIAPEGRLVSAKKYKDHYAFYMERVEQGKRVRKGITKQPRLVEALARKEFLRKVIPALDRNIALLQKTIDKYEPCQPQEIIESLSTAYGNVPEHCFFNPSVDLVNLSLDMEEEQRIKAHWAWGQQSYEASDYLPEGRTIITSRGQRMRSKAEVMIAEKLYEYGIPFRYEQEVVLDGVTLHPDFTFEGADGSEFYLEFCGMMDDERYVENHKRKVAMYQAADIVPWKNIIYVYARGNELDMRQIDSIIRTQVIAWL